MAPDNVEFGTPTATPPSGTVIATDEIGAAHFQRIKLDLGADGASSPLVRGQQADAASIPVSLSTEQAALIDGLESLLTAIQALLSTIDTDTGSLAAGQLPDGHNVTVDNASLAVTGPLTDTELRATPVPVNGSGSTQPVSAASLPLPTGAATAARQLAGTGMVNGQTNVTTTASTVIGFRSTRRSVTIKNQSTSVSVYIGIAVVTPTNGLELGPGESISVDYTGLIQGITASGTARVSTLETF